ncbi:DUF4012 domain-containing protein [Streptomyces sp. ISL-90]|nr:DUF4012 domain-containing protein [Streptomyces sp. ISL-90]
MTTEMPAPRQRRHKRRSRRWMWWTGGLVLVLIAAVAWIGVRGLLAKQELEAALPLAKAVQKQVVAGESDAAAATAAQLVQHAEAAAALTSDPAWRAVEVIPWVGPNLASTRIMAASVQLVAKGAVEPLADAAGAIDLASFKPTGGQVDLQPLIDVQGPLGEASVSLSHAQSMMQDESVASADVIGPLADARGELTDVLVEASATVGALDRAVRLVPVMLGVDGPRDTLLLFQNNAELRATGGISGALALVHTDQGAFELTKQANSQDFPKFDPPVAELPLETRALYGDNTASYIQDVNFTPQFPLAASLAREMWKQKFGDEVDSVVALDPVVLSHLLVATGPITLPTGDTLTSENAVQMLLRDVYERYQNPADQDAFFAAAAASVVVGISGDKVDARKLIDAFIKSGEEHRILIWNADTAEQAVLDGTSLAGGLPVSTDEHQSFGVYLNDTTGAKMGPYLDVKIEAGAVTCRADGLQNYVVSVTLENTAPPDAATSLPRYVRGVGQFGTPPGVIATALLVYGTPGSYNLGVMRDGTAAEYHPTSDSGYTLSKIDSLLAPGERATYEFGFLAGEPGDRAVEVRSTPLVYAAEISSLPISCESALR